MKVFLVADGDGYGDTLSFVVDFNNNFRGLEFLNLLLDELLSSILFVADDGVRRVEVDLRLAILEGGAGALLGSALGVALPLVRTFGSGTSPFALHCL